MRTKFGLDRYAFLSMNIEGKTLDVGCQDGSGWIHGHAMIGKPFDYKESNIYYFDMDKWSHPRFTRGDAHRLPFKNNSFDTVVSGDVLEHVIDPEKFLLELLRVAKKKVIITTPDEYQWHKDLKPFGNTDKVAKELGMTRDQLAERDTVGFKSNYAMCMDYTKESKQRHLYHIRQFTPFTFINLIWLVHQTCELNTLHEPNPIKSFDINHFYHPLAPRTPEEPQDMAYWSCVFYKEG